MRRRHCQTRLLSALFPGEENASVALREGSVKILPITTMGWQVPGPTMQHGLAVSWPEARGRGGRPSVRQSAQLFDRILEVAEKLFLVHGFGATSIEAVAKQAGISKRTFYHRFPGKEQLFEAVVQRLMERWLPPFDSGLLAPPDLADALRDTAEYMLRIALTPEALALHRLVIHEARRFPSLARILHELGAANGIARIASHLEPRIRSGELRAIAPGFAAEQFILSVVSGPQRRALGLGVPLNASEIKTHAANAVTLFLDGARARPEAHR